MNDVLADNVRYRESKQPSIRTPRLLFRLCLLEDLDNFAVLNSDAEVRAFFPDGVQTRAQAEVRLREFMANAASIRVMYKCGMQHYKDAEAKGVMCSFYRMYYS